MKPRLFVFGCSYCTGEELLLDEIKDLNQLRISTANDPRIFFSNLKKDKKLLDQYQDIVMKQKELSWPNLLASRLGIDCVNLAESGNSLDKIIYQISTTKFNPNDFVIVALTNPFRGLYFDQEPKSFQLPNLFWSIKDRLLGVKKNGDIDYVIGKEEDRAILKWFNDDRILWDQIKNISVLGFLKNNLNLVIVPAMSRKDFNLKPYNNCLLQTYDDLENKLLSISRSLDDFTKNRMPWGHPDRSAHESYADHCYEIFRKLSTFN